MNQHRLPDQIPPPNPAANVPTAAWAAWVREQWGAVQVTHLKATPLRADIPGHLRVHTNVHLGSLTPADVRVEATADAAEAVDASGEWPIRLCSMQSYHNGTYVFEALLPLETLEDNPLTVRVRPGAAHETFSALREVVGSFDVRSDFAPVVTKARRPRPEPVTAG
jgi:hypothetical protein